MLYLIDGDALLYRAANAIPLFTNSRGLPINGLHGFVSMIHILLRESHPTHAAVAFTADPPLRKHALDPDYKINHYEHPEEIKLQIPYAMQFVTALGLHAFLEPGFEADDVIATLLQYRGRLSARIVSSDRDFYQFVSERVHVLAPVRGVSEMREIGPPEAEAAFGVRPVQIPDLKAITGDVSDDVPGVHGIGPKTAAALLGVFPTVESLLDNLDQVTIIGTRARLAPMRERILLNKTLVLPAVVPIKKRPNLRIGTPRTKELEELAAETGVGRMKE
ncbi:MAG: 5'-3' exonuclease [bacterium]